MRHFQDDFAHHSRLLLTDVFLVSPKCDDIRPFRPAFTYNAVWHVQYDFPHVPLTASMLFGMNYPAPKRFGNEHIVEFQHNSPDTNQLIGALLQITPPTDPSSKSFPQLTLLHTLHNLLYPLLLSPLGVSEG
jgi:hypothetical protein